MVNEHWRENLVVSEMSLDSGLVPLVEDRGQRVKCHAEAKDNFICNNNCRLSVLRLKIHSAHHSRDLFLNRTISFESQHHSFGVSLMHSKPLLCSYVYKALFL